MVETRHQRRAREQREAEEAPELFAQLERGALPNGPANRMRGARRWVKRYRPTDPYRRHRLADEQPKTQRVAAYVRRT